MSVAEAVPALDGAAAAVSRAPVRRGRFRLLRSELGMIFRRPRNLIALAVLVAVPVFLAIAVKVNPPGNVSDDGPQFLNQITQNGVFVAFTSLVMVLPFFLPLAVSLVSGDSVAGESSLGTLRYLLVVPVHRTRLLAVKYTATVVFCLVATVMVSAAGVVMGLILFPRGRATLLSGTQISLAESIGRLLLVSFYIAACMAAVAAIGLVISTLVSSPMAAMAAIAGLCITSQILDTIPQIDVIHPYLLSHNWLAFGDLMRDPMVTDGVRTGLVSAVAYVALFGSLAWARMSDKDVLG